MGLITLKTRALEFQYNIFSLRKIMENLSNEFPRENHHATTFMPFSPFSSFHFIYFSFFYFYYLFTPCRLLERKRFTQIEIMLRRVKWWKKSRINLSQNIQIWLTPSISIYFTVHQLHHCYFINSPLLMFPKLSNVSHSDYRSFTSSSPRFSNDVNRSFTETLPIPPNK